MSAMAEIDAEITEQVRTELLWIARRYADAARGDRRGVTPAAVRVMGKRWELQARRFEQLASRATQLFAEADLADAVAATNTNIETEACRVH